MSQFIVVLVLVFLQKHSFGFPERGGYDVTNKVKKQTIYIESMIHSGWWLASTFEDRGNSSSSHEIIRDVVGKKSSKKSVFHPGKPFRFEGVDCGSGYVCLRSRFQETNHSDHNSTQDPSSFYLGIYNQAGFLGMPSKKKTPYGGTLSQLGGEGVKINFKMSLLKIPFY